MQYFHVYAYHIAESKMRINCLQTCFYKRWYDFAVAWQIDHALIKVRKHVRYRFLSVMRITTLCPMFQKENVET